MLPVCLWRYAKNEAAAVEVSEVEGDVEAMCEQRFDGGLELRHLLAAEVVRCYNTGCGKAGQPRCPLVEQQFRASIDRKYYAWCSAEESCVAMLPFLWNTVAISKYEIIGASEQPVLLNALMEMGTQIKHARSMRKE